MEVLVFHLSGHRYGVCLADIREVLRAVTFTALPRAPAFVEGIINLRGDLVPVLDVRARFRLAAKIPSESDYLVVAAAGDRVVALRVEGGADVITIDADMIEDPAHVVSRTEFIAGVAKLPDGLVLIHDLRTFLTKTEAEVLAELDVRQASP